MIPEINQTGNIIDYKQISITRPPGGIAPGTTAFFVPLSSQSLLVLELYHKKGL